MNPRVQVVVQAPATLLELEQACAAARAQQFVDDAGVLFPLLSGSLVIVQPVGDHGRPIGADEPAVTTS